MATKSSRSNMSSRTTSSSSPRVLTSGPKPRSRRASKSSKRKHKNKSSKSRSDKGAKKTKFSTPNIIPQDRRRRRPSSATSASQSRFCPHRQGRPPRQFSTGRYPGSSRNHPLLVPSISSFYPPGAAPLAPGTPVSIPGLPPLIAGNPVPLPPGFFPPSPGFFPPSPFMGLAPPAFGGAIMGGGGGGGGAQQPIVLPFPIPMPMPMPTSGASHPPIVIPAPPPPPSSPYPSYPPPMPYPVAAPAMQGGGGSDSMAIMMMMKSMQQERQVAAQEREREQERHQEEKKEEEKRQHKKEKEEEKKRKKKEKEEERKRKKEEREKALEERKKEIERMQEEHRRQIEEAQKAVEEAAAKKKAEKAEALAKKAAEEEEARKKKEEEEKAKQEAEAAAAAAAAAEAEKAAAAADAPGEAHHGAAGEEHPLLAAEAPPDPMAYYAPPDNLPAFDPGLDINPALQMVEPRSTGRLLCFILTFLIVFLGIVVALLYFFAPGLLPFLGTGETTAAAGASETTVESSLRGGVINIDNTPIKHNKGAPGAPVTTPTSSARVFTVTAGLSTRAPTGTTAVPLDVNTIEIALNDRQWAGAADWDDGGRTDVATTSSAELKRTPDIVPFLSAFPPPGGASTTVVVTAKEPQAARSRRPRWRTEMANQSDNAMPLVTALTLDAFLDQGYRQNLKARLFAEDKDVADKKAASRKRPTFDYDNIWNEDDGDDKAATAFTFEGSTKSAIRELLESVQRGQHDGGGVRQSPVSLRSPQVTRGEATPVIADESVNTMNDDFTTESETTRAGAVTLEDFKLYTIAHINPFRGAFEKAIKELKNTRKRPVK